MIKRKPSCTSKIQAIHLMMGSMSMVILSMIRHFDRNPGPANTSSIPWIMALGSITMAGGITTQGLSSKKYRLFNIHSHNLMNLDDRQTKCGE